LLNKHILVKIYNYDKGGIERNVDNDLFIFNSSIY